MFKDGAVGSSRRLIGIAILINGNRHFNTLQKKTATKVWDIVLSGTVPSACYCLTLQKKKIAKDLSSHYTLPSYRYHRIQCRATSDSTGSGFQWPRCIPPTQDATGGIRVPYLLDHQHHRAKGNIQGRHHGQVWKSNSIFSFSIRAFLRDDSDCYTFIWHTFFFMLLFELPAPQRISRQKRWRRLWARRVNMDSREAKGAGPDVQVPGASTLKDLDSDAREGKLHQFVLQTSLPDSWKQRECQGFGPQAACIPCSVSLYQEP